MKQALRKQRATATGGLRASRRRFRWSRHTVAVVAVGLTLTLVAFLLTGARETTKDVLALERETHRLASTVAAQFNIPVLTLQGTAAYFSASEHVTRREFRAFTRSALRKFPQIYCFEWMPLVTGTERQSFEAEARRSVSAEYTITVKDPSGRKLLPAPELDAYLPILYMEPLNETVLGLDTGATESARVSTGRRAWVEKRITVSHPYRLVEDPEGLHSLTCYAPVFDLSDVPYDSIATAEGDLVGLVAVIMRLEPTISSAKAASQADDLELAVLDTTDPDESVLIYASGDAIAALAQSNLDLIGQAPHRPHRTPVTWSPPLEFADRVWYVATRPIAGSALAEPGNTAWLVLLAGLALTGALTWGTGMLLATLRLRREVDAALELGQYRLGRKLGEGGMGVVFEAEHRMLARPAAIKLIRAENLGAGNSGSEPVLERFENEAKATARLSSPHTINVFDFGRTENGEFYYVMELLEGFDLESLVQKYGPVEPERAVHVLRQACHSLAEAHAAGLIHRDIKPANLYVCRAGLDVDVVKVLDFGLVKRRPSADGGDDAGITRDNEVVGTPQYLAPEAALGSVELDGRSDIYALGCVAYWLLTGGPVFDGATPMAVIVQHLREAPPRLSERTEIAVPAALEEIVLQCLAKERDARPRDALELASLLAATGLSWEAEKARRWWDAHDPGREAGSDRAQRTATPPAPTRAPRRDGPARS